jgi:phosphate/sulfate permease
MLTVWLLISLFSLLAIVDLIVGVSNDGVNFLNSAFGSKVAKRRTILIVASVGLLLGSFFASGLMDLPRSGIINPENFSFFDITAVFVSVMLAHILLIDAFNYYGIPTSTTTLLIFLLVGGALAIAVIKWHQHARLVEIGLYINTGKLFLILVGIFLSVFAAFILGLLVQLTARMVFTFNYRHRLGWFFSLAASFAFTVIIYLIIKKALYTDMFQLGVWYDELLSNLPQFLLSVFVMVFFISLVAIKLFHIDVSRWVVFFGTFAIAMSFTSNDLVNFIGIPLAMAESSIMSVSGNAGSTSFVAETFGAGLTFPSWVYLFVFVLSALIMAATLFVSRKAKYVIDTELLLERQASGFERFEPTQLSRSLVRHIYKYTSNITKHIPKPLVAWLEKRFQPTQAILGNNDNNPAFFDLIRASVNLTVASIMILVGTWFRLPLSTTFIVFMVSIGTSLSDMAWNRENAVYRLSGVFTILGTWFFGSMAALIMAFVFTIVVWFGGWVAIVLLVAITAWALYKSKRSFRISPPKHTRELEKNKTRLSMGEALLTKDSDHFRKPMIEASKIYFLVLQGFIDESTVMLKQAKKSAAEMRHQNQEARDSLLGSLRSLPDHSLEAGQCYIQVLDYVSELSNSLLSMASTVYEHVHNNHKGLKAEQQPEFLNLIEETTSFFNLLIHIEKEQHFTDLNDAVQRLQLLMAHLDDLRKRQVKRIKSGDAKTRVSILYLDVVADTKNILLYAINIMKSHRDFMNAMQTNP